MRIVSGPNVTVRVVSAQTGAPLAGVTVTVNQTVYTDPELTTGVTSVVSNGSGVISFYAAPGSYTFTTSSAAAAAIEPVEVLGGEEGIATAGLTGKLNATYVPAKVVLPSGDATGATDKAAINAALASGAAIVVLQGDYYINGAVLPPSNTTLVLFNAALHLTAAANDNVIRNSLATAGTAQSSIRIVGIGRAVIDGNASNQVRQAKLWQNHGIVLLNVTDFKIEGLQVGPTNAYGLYIAACTKGRIRSVRFNQDALTANQDGIDIIWACSDISVDDISGVVNDDAIGIGNWDPTNLANELPYISGDMSDIRVSNVRISSPFRAVRIINGDGHVINKVRLSGIHNSNSSALHGVLFGPSSLPAVAPTAAQCKNIEITDVSGRSSGPFLCFDQSCTGVRISGVAVDGGAATLFGNQVVTNQTIKQVSVRDVVIQGGVTNLMKFTGGTIYQPAIEGVTADTVTTLLANTGATVSRASFKNWVVDSLVTAICSSTAAEGGTINGLLVVSGSPRWTGATPVMRFGPDMPVMTSADTLPSAATVGSVINVNGSVDPSGAGDTTPGQYVANGTSWFKGAVYAPDEYVYDAFAVLFDNSAGWTYVQSGSFYNAKYAQSSGTQNDYLTFAPRFFRAGHWSLSLLNQAGTNRGIVTVSISTDNTTWTDLGTIDSYNAVNNTNTRATLTNLAISEGRYYLRLKVAAKNASSTSYFLQLNSVIFTRMAA